MSGQVRLAVVLMRMALALLDRDRGELLAAARLQHAIDSVGRGARPKM